MHALLGDLANIAEAEHLETAGVRQDRAFPLHEIMQIAMQFHDFLTRAQPQVEGVAENNLCAGGFNFFRRHAFNGAIRTDRHKSRRFHYATIKHQAATASASVGSIQFEFHFLSIRQKNSLTFKPVPRTYFPTRSFKACGLYVINIASP